MTADLFASDMAALAASAAYDLTAQQDVRYSYWPVNYYLGDPTVISAAPLPLSGVKFSSQAKGTGELRASLQLADPDVRAMNPWHLVVPRKTGIVVVRSWRAADSDENTWTHRAVWQGTVWEAPTDDQTGRMEITARTVEYNWAQRLITGPMAGGDLFWAQKDRTVIVQDLLTPERFSQVGPPSFGEYPTAAVSGSVDRVVVSDTNADLVAVGSYIRVRLPSGAYRVGNDGVSTVFRVTGKTYAGAIASLQVTPFFPELPQLGETVVAIQMFPGWVNVDKPTTPTGRVHDFTYRRDQQTNLLEAHQDRSKVDDGYDWFTSVRVLDGANAYDASSFRVQYVMGYPRLGREYGVDDIPRFSRFIDGRGNVTTADTVYDGSGVRNVMWGAGSGFDEATVRAQATFSQDWANGFLITEGRYSNPDVSVQATLQAYTNAALVQTYANERFVRAVTVRGDLPPYFDTYSIYDDALYTSDGWGNPDGPDGDRSVTYLTRIMGWTVTPPEGNNNETVQLLLAGGGAEGGNYG